MEELGHINCRINLSDIKSSFVKKILFSFLPTKKELNIVMYNKKLQKMLSINPFDYELISGKEKIVNKNGKGKEYKWDRLFKKTLIFKGEYLNKKRNGKGKEYYVNGELKFKGKYINGERNGKGIEFDYNGNSKFEREYLNGKRWNGKGYNKEGKIDSVIQKGNGKGKEYNYDDKLLYL